MSESEDQRIYREDQERIRMEQLGLQRGAPVATPHGVSAPPPVNKVQAAVQEAVKNPQVTHVAMTEEQEKTLAEAKTQPPVNVDVPFVQQQDAVVTCTMGNWHGEPETYAYAWDMDGAAVGDDSPSLTIDGTAIGTTVSCVVSATNEHGTTAAPPSNAVVIT
jgi:hypothetical protein